MHLYYILWLNGPQDNKQNWWANCLLIHWNQTSLPKTKLKTLSVVGIIRHNKILTVWSAQSAALLSWQEAMKWTRKTGQIIFDRCQSFWNTTAPIYMYIKRIGIEILVADRKKTFDHKTIDSLDRHCWFLSRKSLERRSSRLYKQNNMPQILKCTLYRLPEIIIRHRTVDNIHPPLDVDSRKWDIAMSCNE